MFNKLGEIMIEYSAHFNRVRKYKDSKWAESILTEIKYILEGINSRLDDTEYNISGQSSRNQWSWTEKGKYADSLWHFCENIKYTNICMIGVLRGERVRDLTWRNNRWKLPKPGKHTSRCSKHRVCQTRWTQRGPHQNSL